MPVVAGGDQHGVDVVAVEQLQHVTIHHAVLVGVLGVRHLLDGLAPTGLHVANRHELHVGLAQHAAQHVPPPRADPNRAQDDPLAGSNRAVAAQGRRADKPRRADGCGRRRLQKTPSGDGAFRVHEVFLLLVVPVR